MRYLLLALALGTSFLVRSQPMNDSIEVAGIYRSFHFNEPTGIRKGASLVFVLHGSGGTGLNAMKGAEKLELLKSKEQIIVVYPDGYHRFWNECRKFSTAEANTMNIDENAFFSGMIDLFNRKYEIDRKKVFLIGFSGGGHMAYKFALTMPEKFRALTAVVANMPDTGSIDCGEAKKAIPIMIVNGTKDQTNPYDGGEMFVDNHSFGVVRSTERSFQYWASLAGYTGQPVMNKLPDVNTGDNQTIESYTYKASGKPEVVLLKVIGGTHSFPSDVDVYEEAWRFFKRQINNLRM